MRDGKFLIDTNFVIGLFKEDSNAIQFLQEGNEVILNSIVLGELYYGAFKSDKVISNIQKIDQLKSAFDILPCDESTSQIYGQLKNQLQSAGTPIPENDIWIAALAYQHDLNVLTQDHHFSKILDIKFESW